MPSLERSAKILEGAEVFVEGSVVTVKGPLGSLSRDFGHARVSIAKKDGNIVLATDEKGRAGRSILGTVAKHVENMMLGTTKGFQCKMKVIHSHFPITLKVVGDRIQVRNFMGERAPREAKLEDPNIKVEIKGDDVVIKGIDVEKVMQTAANLENATRTVGKDQRIYLDGIYVVERGHQVG
ncbi:MAG: 50S ribosomal protein L6 [Thermoproteota archaeon]